MTTLDRRQLAEIITEIRDLTRTLEHDLPATIDRANAARRDGYPTSSLPGGRGGPTLAPDDDDPDRTSVPLTSVEAAVLSDHQASAVRHCQDAIRHLLEGRNWLRGAVGRMRQAQPIVDEHPPDPDEWCTSCQRAHVHNPPYARSPYAGQLCRWCYDFHAAEGVTPPLELIEARAQGRRITQPMVIAALAASRQVRSTRSRLARATVPERLESGVVSP